MLFKIESTTGLTLGVAYLVYILPLWVASVATITTTITTKVSINFAQQYVRTVASTLTNNVTTKCGINFDQ